MGNDRLNTTEANAGIDLEHLAKCLTSDGTLNNAYVGEHFNETPGWSTLAAEVLRLRAEARETALQYLSDRDDDQDDDWQAQAGYDAAREAGV